jgi:prepilin-type N-terminal cleavage/methylation domain-containing protein
MARTVSRPPHASRPGYTLIELLIVVALLLVVVSLSWPSLRQLAERRELLTAARVLRGELLRARLDAIRTGRVSQFRYQPDSGSYSSGPVTAAPVESGEALVAWDAESPGASLEEPAVGDAQLPSDVRFVDASLPVEQLASRDEQGTSDSEVWSEPLLFYPNGRTFNARLRLTSRRFCVDLTVRGITGSVAVGPVQRIQVQEEPLPEVVVP